MKQILALLFLLMTCVALSVEPSKPVVPDPDEWSTRAYRFPSAELASGMSYLATDTSTPYTANFDAANAGKTVYFTYLWENTKGETSPQSEVLRAIIPR